MRPREKGGVVDKDLNVYGVTRLKVAGLWRSLYLSFTILTLVDLSIAPSNVNCVCAYFLIHILSNVTCPEHVLGNDRYS